MVSCGCAGHATSDAHGMGVLLPCSDRNRILLARPDRLEQRIISGASGVCHIAHGCTDVFVHMDRHCTACMVRRC